MAPSTTGIVAGVSAIAAFYVLMRRLRQRQTVVLITGASGYLGQHLLQRLANNARYSLHGTYSGNPSFVEDWDGAAVCHKVAMDDPRAIAALMDKVRPDVVVHLAAISSPAKAEGIRSVPKRSIVPQRSSMALSRMRRLFSYPPIRSIAAAVRHTLRLLPPNLSTSTARVSSISSARCRQRCRDAAFRCE